MGRRRFSLPGSRAPSPNFDEPRPPAQLSHGCSSTGSSFGADAPTLSFMQIRPIGDDKGRAPPHRMFSLGDAICSSSPPPPTSKPSGDNDGKVKKVRQAEECTKVEYCLKSAEGSALFLRLH
uniref:Uncharacterized protein n=1 Tax=Steinernema glaseri TaxID=37863 RepID=A0A1I7YV77_9BILA